MLYTYSISGNVINQAPAITQKTMPASFPEFTCGLYTSLVTTVDNIDADICIPVAIENTDPIIKGVIDHVTKKIMITLLFIFY